MELNKKLFYSFLFHLSNHSFILLHMLRHPFFLAPCSLNHVKNNHGNFVTKNFFIGVLAIKYGFCHIITILKSLVL